MLQLVQIYKASNPQATDAEFQRAVKRKFMQGISPELRRAIFVYNSDPHAVTVNYQRLLEYARSAQLNLLTSPEETSSPVTTINATTETPTNSNNEISALRQDIQDLSTNLDTRLSLLEQSQSDAVNSFYGDSRGRFQHRGRGRGRGRGNRG